MTDRSDIQAQAMCRELRQEGYLVPYPVMMKAMQAAALRPEAQDGVADAARVLLAEHERCSAIPTHERTHAEQCAAQMGRNRLRALSQGGK